MDSSADSIMAGLSADSDSSLLNLIYREKLSLCKCLCILSLPHRHVHVHWGIHWATDANPCLFLCNGSIAVSRVPLVCNLFPELSGWGSLLVRFLFSWVVLNSHNPCWVVRFRFYNNAIRRVLRFVGEFSLELLYSSRAGLILLS